MPSIALKTTDPLARFRAGAVFGPDRRPVPLIATRIHVAIRGGLAHVGTERVFRNAEENSIEATITFPVPVLATLTGLTAVIDGREMKAVAQRRAAARATYEAAIDSGKTAILHEEALRGVHVLSVGHIPAGKEIAVTSRWVAAVERGARPGSATLRIPTTVGDIFGRSPLMDSDDLSHDSAAVHYADLTMTTDVGAIRLAWADLQDGAARVRLDAPIDLIVTNWSPGTAEGIAADGRAVRLRIIPDVGGDDDVSAAILVDHSGSMGALAYGDGPDRRTKHQVVVEALRDIAGDMRHADQIDLWEFNGTAQRVAGGRPGLLASVDALSPPGGGTELGVALAAAIASATRDVVLLTDGKSHSVDVQTLARAGKRVSVILVGEDSLAANVGYLAALTGGQIFVATGADAGAALRHLVASLRQKPAFAPPISGAPTEISALIGGMSVHATWGAIADGGALESVDDAEQHDVGAFAASLALTRLTEDEAAELAVAHGIVCHLTSLVLVDAEGETQDGIPAQRKVALMTPRTAKARKSQMLHRVRSDAFPMADPPAPAPAAAPAPAPVAAAAPSPAFDGAFAAPSPARPSPMPPASPPPPPRGPRAGGLGDALRSVGHGAAEALRGLFRGAATPAGAAPDPFAPPPPVPTLPRGRINWSSDPERLRRGDFSAIPADLAAALRRVASLPAVAALAASLGVDAAVVALALLARAEAASDRGAARFSRAVLGAADPTRVEAAARAAGL